jgi:hypothetical protein
MQIRPKQIIPIHTFDGDKYQDIFEETVKVVNDGEIINI